jgi:hypothetical protein
MDHRSFPAQLECSGGGICLRQATALNIDASAGAVEEVARIIAQIRA